jgi:LmbE family N-acetylglucosaminyl deacetylase
MKLKRLRTKHFIMILLTIIVLFCATFFAREFFANLFVGIAMEELPLPGAEDKVLIFAPHSDDEALAAAQLIKKSLAAGAKVKVVLATNGDGFVQAFSAQGLSSLPKREDYIQEGYEHQKESLAALRLLGMNDEDVIFLGYPDRVISSLWNYNWMSSLPYLSGDTETQKSPYENSYTADALYCGESLYQDISNIIQAFRPTYVVYPHPSDTHTDHWGLYAFVKLSLTSLHYTPKEELLYLVHKAAWPAPLKRNRSLFLVPPMSLLNSGTQWFSLSMTDKEVEEKAFALNQYQSQLRRVGLLLSSFERKNELFGIYKDAKLVRYSRHDEDITPNSDNKIIDDAKKDAITLEIKNSSDITAIHAELSKENNLHTFIHLNSKPDKLTTYYLNLVFVKKGQNIPMKLMIKNKKLEPVWQQEASIMDTSHIQVETTGRNVHIIIPNNKIGIYDNIFINAESSISPYYMDRTAWRMMDVR